MSTLYAHRYESPKWQAYVTPEASGFAFESGFFVTSLYELKQALLNLPEDEITLHIKKDDNHLASWVENVVGDTDLANALRSYDHRWGMVVALERQMMRTLNLPAYVAKRWLKEVALPFVFVSGESVNSLESLSATLETVSDAAVEFHLERTPNDISKWVQDIIGDYELAELIQEGSNRAQIARFVTDHLAMLKDAAQE